MCCTFKIFSKIVVENSVFLVVLRIVQITYYYLLFASRQLFFSDLINLNSELVLLDVIALLLNAQKDNNFRNNSLGCIAIYDYSLTIHKFC